MDSKADSKTPTLLLDFDPDRFEIKHVAVALEKILGKLGCPGCGRLSIHIQALEDPEWVQLNEIESLRTVTAIEPQIVLTGMRG